MASPTALCEIAFASNPADTPVWTDVTAYLMEFRTTRGRQAELNRIEAGTAEVVLNNIDRRFDPSNASSPYAPNVLPVRRIRLSATYNAVTYRVFSGYIETWPPDYPGPLDSNVRISATDGFKVLNLKALPGNYPALVLSHSPIGYWRMNDTTGTTAVDSATVPHNGTYSGGFTLLAPTALGGDEGNAVTLNGTTGTITVASNSAFDLTTTFTLEAWVKCAAYPAQAVPINRLGWWVLTIDSATSIAIRDRNGHFASFTVPSIAGIWAHVVGVKPDNTLTNCRLYVNGVTYTPTSTSGPWAPTGGANAVNIGSVEGPTSLINGSIDEVAVYSTALTAAQARDHYAAGVGTFPTQDTGARITSVLNIVGWPAGDRSIGVGDTTIQGGTIQGTSALEHIGECLDSENGLFFMTGDGIAKFVNRGARLIPPYTTSQATFGDDSAGGELLYVDIVLDYSDVQLWNDIRYTRQGGTVQVASDATSQARYYTRSLIKDSLLMSTDNEALAAAQWARDRFRNPALRIQRVLLDGEADPANIWPQAFGRDLGDRVTIRKTPPGGGVRIEQVGHIEQIDHSFSAEGGVWSTAWQLSPADSQLYWILEHAVQGVLDTSTVLSY